MVLNVLLPVKYNIANAYSSGAVYKKSTRLARIPGLRRAIVRLFVGPLVRTSITILLLTRISKKSLNAFRLLSRFVIIKSISPESAAPRRYDPTTSNFDPAGVESANMLSK